MAKILLVDDSKLSRRILRNILEPAGHEIIEAADGITAIESYFLEHPDLVLLDLLMAEMRGEEVLEKLISLEQTAKVIIASADLQTLTHQLLARAGALEFIPKPFVAEQVLKTVNAVLTRGK